VEAMNLILEQDGIIAYIGTRSEFGEYLSELKKEPGQGGLRCWTSLPASTILNILGLYQLTQTLEGPSQVFHGSPVVLMLSMILHCSETDPVLVSLRQGLELGKGVVIEVSPQQTLGRYRDMLILHNELEEAFSYLDVT